MPVITVTGLIGSGVIEIGPKISDKLGIDHVDRTILAEAARKIGASEEDIADRTERAPGLGDRIAGFVKTVLERSALAGGGADPISAAGSTRCWYASTGTSRRRATAPANWTTRTS